ncbi:MAG: class I SAM-dependent methyltransferase [Chthoniobacterales bacterium]
MNNFSFHKNLLEKICKEGPISFADFMQAALYDRVHGYYGSGRVNIGKAGDFFTNVSVGKIYGRILTYFFEDLWMRLGRPKKFLIVEQGAHDGKLASDILESLAAEERKEFAACVDYLIIEPFITQRSWQQATLKKFNHIEWTESEESLPSFEGVHFSNELLDAFPVHILIWDGSAWLEKCVDVINESFCWITLPITKPNLIKAAALLPKNLPKNFHVEIRLTIHPWLANLSKKIKRGAILIADYGSAGIERFLPHRSEGTIACYTNHKRYDNPLTSVGERDITAHVDFTNVTEAARETGFEILGYCDQHHFLIGAAEKWLRGLEEKNSSMLTPHDLRALQTLLHPESMGRQFKFLGLGKNIPTIPPLDGFKYQRLALEA